MFRGGVGGVAVVMGRATARVEEREGVVVG